ncbi:KGGVGR-motif variant AAA ATPase [Sorangium cellulosum]|uniref:KGGVGR-motif variant AAA ATPase n=1 Tax=Sorangium cellulosum TaxID=56 RepID=UPI00165163EE|nr:AAA family ATPase [Sorangium cellulosum]
MRDIYGRIRVVVGDDVVVPPALAEELHDRLGHFSPGQASIFVQRAFFASEELSTDRVLLDEGVWLVDHLVSEQGWRRAPVASPAHCPRIIFFGIKGGVGRSTALVALAKRLAEQGLRVLVVDLDLESPGATSMLLDLDELPPFGVVDWFVEDAVGMADDTLLRGMVVPSRVGEVLVAPAVGTRSVPVLDEEELERDPMLSLRDGTFIAKLGRTYASPAGAEFAERIERLLVGLERVHEPQVVLLDSRAGMHDIAAAAVPRLGGTVLLFAGATSQTWLGYRLLFSAWGREREVVERFRDRLRVVAAQVPETGRDAYLGRLREAAYDLFAGFIYEESGTADAFSFDVNDPEAPHEPLPIYWRRELVEWEPAAPPGPMAETVTTEQFEAAFGPFLRGVLALPYVAELLQSDEEAP